MPYDIHHDVYINAASEDVYDAISTPEGLDSWWSLESAGTDEIGSDVRLFFGEGYDWKAKVLLAERNRQFIIEMMEADDDWETSVISFELKPEESGTTLRFAHTGWPELNDHFKRSSFCWAMYLRHLKRYCESGTKVPYADRYSA